MLVTRLQREWQRILRIILKKLESRVKYLHSDIDTLERTEIIRDMRLDVFDVLVGINLLRGKDLIFRRLPW